MPQPKTIRTIKSSTDVEAAIRALVEYNWKDELRDFEENHRDDCGSHIFRVMVALDNWIAGSSHTAESYLPKAATRQESITERERIDAYERLRGMDGKEANRG